MNISPIQYYGCNHSTNQKKTLKSQSFGYKLPDIAKPIIEDIRKNGSNSRWEKSLRSFEERTFDATKYSNKKFSDKFNSLSTFDLKSNFRVNAEIYFENEFNEGCFGSSVSSGWVDSTNRCMVISSGKMKAECTRWDISDENISPEDIDKTFLKKYLSSPEKIDELGNLVDETIDKYCRAATGDFDDFLDLIDSPYINLR